MFQAILKRDDRESTALRDAEEALTALARGAAHENYADSFGGIDPYVAQLVHTRAERRAEWAQEYAYELAQRDGWEQTVEQAQDRAHEVIAQRERERDLSRDDDLGMEIG